ncbi:MAG: sugar phosphate isomerase/epimerase family protein [bacterium]
MNQYHDRRAFLGLTAGLLGTGMIAHALPGKKQKMQLAFSSIGCPDWPLDKMVKFAREKGYQGIELRGLLRELDLPRSSDFNGPDKIRAARKMVEDNGLKFVCLGASAPLHHPEGAKREQSIDEGKRFIDLAEALGCPYVRVFPNNLPKDQDKAMTLQLIRQGLQTLGDHAAKTKVAVLMETHGDLIQTADIAEVMQGVERPNVGLVWDFTNMWSITKEAPISVYPKLAPYIRHVHVKDYKMQDGKMRYTLLGQGMAPAFQALDLLQRAGYKGFYSFEWEKLWHPELEEPDTALEHYVQMMRSFENR